MGGGWWFESKFSVSFGPIGPGLKPWIRTWTKLNNSNTVLIPAYVHLYMYKPTGGLTLDKPVVDIISKPVKTPERVQTESEEESGILITDIERNRCVSGQSTEGLSTFQSLPATSPLSLSDLPPPLPEINRNLLTRQTSREITETRAQPPAIVQTQARKRKRSNEKGSGVTAGRAAVKKFKYKVGNNQNLYLHSNLIPNAHTV